MTNLTIKEKKNQRKIQKVTPLATKPSTEIDWQNQQQLNFIRNHLVQGSLTDNEWALFVGIAKRTNMNPLLREIYAIKYKTKYGEKTQIFISRDGYRKAAQAHPQYESHSVFSVYENDQLAFNEQGIPKLTPNLKNRGALVGAIAWCKRKNSTDPNCAGLIPLQEYNTQKSNWAKMPDTMIKKVAESQILRQTFQEIFLGTYDESERDQIEQAAKSVQPKAIPVEAARLPQNPPPMKKILTAADIQAQTAFIKGELQKGLLLVELIARMKKNYQLAKSAEQALVAIDNQFLAEHRKASKQNIKRQAKTNLLHKTTQPTPA